MSIGIIAIPIFILLFAGMLFGIFISEYIRYKFAKNCEYKFWGSEGAFKTDAEKY